MKKHWKIVIVVAVLVFSIITMAVVLLPKGESERARNGHIVGENPNDISIEELPICNFTGAGYLHTPCYEENGTINL